jgi:hypothetical protein
VTGACSTCHNGVNATGKPANHFITSLQCDSCHNTRTWLPLIPYRHTSPNYPGDHAPGIRCVSCHTGNSQIVTWPQAAYRPSCAGCHAGDFRPDKHQKVSNPRVLYTVSELRNCAGACHRYRDSTLTVIDQRRDSKHRPSQGSW